MHTKRKSLREAAQGANLGWARRWKNPQHVAVVKEVPVADLTMEVAFICPMWASNFQVEGSGENKYDVTINPYDPASCTCPAFKYSGEWGMQHCKHINRVETKGCFYHPERSQHPGVKTWNEFDFDNNGIEWLNSGGNVVEPKKPCPGCGNPMIVVRIAV
jgi:hypothetical protein